ncbi:MAG: hypothetical protein U0X40_06970 [Ferruginibacter sp.]
MPQFTVRFELDSNDPNDYKALDERLILFNFTEILMTDDGQAHVLPRGEYRIEGDLTCQRVLDLALLAADQFKDRCKVLVTESAELAWFGLSRA